MAIFIELKLNIQNKFVMIQYPIDSNSNLLSIIVVSIDDDEKNALRLNAN